MSRDGHERFHELLAERLDTPLEGADDAALVAHLADCGACRAVARDYDAQRQQLRQLVAIEPPRDLWARTRTAIDREIARDGRRARPAPALRMARAGRQRPLRMAVGSLVGVMLVLLIAGGSLLRSAPPNLPGPTPFSIPPQSIAWIDGADGKLTLYQTDVAQACPPTHVDCRSDPESHPVAQFLGAGAQDMALGGNGQVFIASRDASGGEVYSIVDLAPAPGPHATPTAAPETAKPGGPSSKPTATPGDTSTAEPGGSPTSSAAISPPSSAGLPIAAARPILTGVRGTGSPAAWSADGTVLAFSAQPIDDNQGSDVYTWRPGEDVALPLTSDHRSVFASWAGNRIVVSRVTLPDASDKAGVPTAATVVVDPATAEERAVALPDSWLPSVDPTGHWVVYWTGVLATKDDLVVAGSGELLVADWASIDPWAADDAAAAASPGPSGSGDAAATPSPSPRPKATDRPTDSPKHSVTPDASGGTGLGGTGLGGTASPALPDRPDAVSGETVDWVVRWSADGSAFGIWVAASADDAGAGWLTIRSSPTADPPAGKVLLGPAAARRSFAVGADRVVWVSPKPNGDGELWMATWGSGGPGSLRIRSLDSSEAVPAF
ncbi:MAG: hypothetical protein ACRDF7_02215 [Candidatus Limnocylindrales bacterium]